MGSEFTEAYEPTNPGPEQSHNALQCVLLSSSPLLLIRSLRVLQSLSPPSVAKWVCYLFPCLASRARRLARGYHREPVPTGDDLAGSSTTTPFLPHIWHFISLSLDSSSTLAENSDNGGFKSPTKDLRGSHKGQRFLGGRIRFNQYRHHGCGTRIW